MAAAKRSEVQQAGKAASNKNRYGQAIVDTNQIKKDIARMDSSQRRLLERAEKSKSMDESVKITEARNSITKKMKAKKRYT